MIIQASLLSRSVVTFLLVAGFGAAALNASIAINTGNPGNQDTDNILFNTGLILEGNTVQGVTNTTPQYIVDFTSDTKLQASGGQARIEAFGRTNQNPLTFDDLKIDMNDPSVYFTKAIFNINADTGGSVQITAYDQNNLAFVSNFTLGSNGENFFNIVASGGSLIDRITIIGSSINSVDFQDARQIRLGGVQVVPEPGFYGVVGIGMSALFLIASRRRITNS